MDKPKMLNSTDYNFDIWYETNDPVFSDISLNSRLPRKWVSYEPVRVGKYADSIIKPINSYVQSLVPPPTLVNIEGNTVRLRQENHAEFFLLEKEDGSFRNIDRPWMRQYYNTAEEHIPMAGCFPGTFKFYTPWFLDHDGIEISYDVPDAETPFYVYPKQFTSHKAGKGLDFMEPEFISFHFKRVGPHMQNEKFGKIKRQQPMYDMVFQADDIIVERVRKFYEQN
jgi:hypothetical protein